jgi:hypothetical protein
MRPRSARSNTQVPSAFAAEQKAKDVFLNHLVPREQRLTTIPKTHRGGTMSISRERP